MAPPTWNQTCEDQMLDSEMDYDYNLARRWTEAPEVESETLYNDSNPAERWDSVEKPKTYTLLGSSGSSLSSSHSSTSSDDSSMSTSIPSTVMQYSPLRDERYEALDLWRYRHPQTWTESQVMGFLHYFGERSDFDIRTFHGENFQDVTGAKLCAMTQEELLKREPNYGNEIYMFLQKMTSELDLKPDRAYLDENPMFGVPPSDDLIEDPLWKLDQAVDFNETPETLDVKIGQHTYALNPNPKSLENLTLLLSSPPQNARQHYAGFHDPFSVDHYDPTTYNPYSQQGYYSNTPTPPLKPKVEPCSKPVRRIPVKYRQKRRINKYSSSEESSDSEVETRPRKGKGNRLWEFIANLLKSSQYNPRVIKWEDRANGIFRIVQSERVASMWGSKKNNEHMTYEKLSRALRFSRTAGYFDEVPKDGRFPKKLCFKFGKRAIID